MFSYVNFLELHPSININFPLLFSSNAFRVDDVIHTLCVHAQLECLYGMDVCRTLHNVFLLS